jgi:hypothetical protein
MQFGVVPSGFLGSIISYLLKQMKNGDVDWVDIDVSLMGVLSRYPY